MTEKEFLIHGCEQVLRFSRVENWADLSEERKVQLGFNMGVVAHGLNLAKEDGYFILTGVREGTLSMAEFREKMAKLFASRGISVDETNIQKPF